MFVMFGAFAHLPFGRIFWLKEHSIMLAGRIASRVTAAPAFPLHRRPLSKVRNLSLSRCLELSCLHECFAQLYKVTLFAQQRGTQVDRQL